MKMVMKFCLPIAILVFPSLFGGNLVEGPEVNSQESRKRQAETTVEASSSSKTARIEKDNDDMMEVDGEMSPRPGCSLTRRLLFDNNGEGHWMVLVDKDSPHGDVDMQKNGASFDGSLVQITTDTDLKAPLIIEFAFEVLQAEVPFTLLQSVDDNSQPDKTFIIRIKYVTDFGGHYILDLESTDRDEETRHFFFDHYHFQAPMEHNIQITIRLTGLEMIIEIVDLDEITRDGPRILRSVKVGFLCSTVSGSMQIIQDKKLLLKKVEVSDRCNLQQQ